MCNFSALRYFLVAMIASLASDHTRACCCEDCEDDNDDDDGGHSVLCRHISVRRSKRPARASTARVARLASMDSASVADHCDSDTS